MSVFSRDSQLLQTLKEKLYVVWEMQLSEIQELLGQLRGVLNDKQTTKFNWVLDKFSDVKAAHTQLFELLHKAQLKESQSNKNTDRIPIKRREEKAIKKQIERRDNTLDLTMEGGHLGRAAGRPMPNWSKPKEYFVAEESTIQREPSEDESSSDSISSLFEDESYTIEDCISKSSKSSDKEFLNTLIFKKEQISAVDSWRKSDKGNLNNDSKEIPQSSNEKRQSRFTLTSLTVKKTIKEGSVSWNDKPSVCWVCSKQITTECKTVLDWGHILHLSCLKQRLIGNLTKCWRKLVCPAVGCK